MDGWVLDNESDFPVNGLRLPNLQLLEIDAEFFEFDCKTFEDRWNGRIDFYKDKISLSHKRSPFSLPTRFLVCEVKGYPLQIFFETCMDDTKCISFRSDECGDPDNCFIVYFVLEEKGTFESALNNCRMQWIIGGHFTESQVGRVLSVNHKVFDEDLLIWHIMDPMDIEALLRYSANDEILEAANIEYRDNRKCRYTRPQNHWSRRTWAELDNQRGHPYLPKVRRPRFRNGRLVTITYTIYIYSFYMGIY